MTAKQNTVANGDAVSRQPAVQFMKGDQGSNRKDERYRWISFLSTFTHPTRHTRGDNSGRRRHWMVITRPGFQPQGRAASIAHI
eukprot:scaffold26821_cov38-Attheya_sp.AAC.1